MTQEQLKLYDAAFEAKVDYKPHSETEHFSEYFEHGFRVGGRAILDNPGEWGLVPKAQHDHYMAKYTSLVEWYDRLMGTPCEQVRHQQEIESLQAQNERYREALERLERLTSDNPDYEFINHIAKEALKQQDDETDNTGN